ncbi:MAG: NAD(P)H-dependent oxidoreductase subunit E [Oscillospiraceae bacterium]
MASKISKIPFKGTKEQEAQLRKIISDNKDMRGALMPVLQKAQEIYGYLPIEVQNIVADGLSISVEEVYGVSTFYSQFSLNPKGKYKVSVCLGTACYVKGSGAVLDRVSRELAVNPGECSLDGKYSLEASRCIGACGLAPVMTVNEEVFGRLVPDDVPTILAKFKD